MIQMAVPSYQPFQVPGKTTGEIRMRNLGISRHGNIIDMTETTTTTSRETLDKPPMQPTPGEDSEVLILRPTISTMHKEAANPGLWMSKPKQLRMLF
jgi:hypothetical protein